MQSNPSDRVFDSVEVANYIIKKSTEDGRFLDALKVMKLVYIAHGWTLGLLNRPLLEDDVEAWQYGPVVRRLYSHVRGKREIIEPFSSNVADLDHQAKNVCDQVIEKYGKLDGTHLSQLTHQKGTPWDITWRAYGKNAVISQDLIQRHFKELSGAA